MWEERSLDQETPVAWRFALEDSRTGRRSGFANLEALVERLEQEIARGRNQVSEAISDEEVKR
jgi:hypothetical protein